MTCSPQCALANKRDCARVYRDRQRQVRERIRTFEPIIIEADVPLPVDRDLRWRVCVVED